MKDVTMLSLLTQDEDKLRNTLRAHEDIEKNRELQIETLRQTLGDTLLRYNASHADEPLRQAVADALAATAREELELLRSVSARQELGPKETPVWAPMLLLAALALGAAALFAFPRQLPAAALCVFLALCAAFAAGRGWFRPRRTQVRAVMDAEKLWRALRLTGETMDRKLDACCARAGELCRTETRAESGDGVDRASLALCGELLEALYARNGALALQRLEGLRAWLRERGVALEDYDGENAALFELLPSRRGAATLRPALVRGEKLLLAGRATERTD